MKILNYGSLNIDLVYEVDHIVSPGETVSCSSYKRIAGGKGLNQSIALSRAGAKVYHAGRIGHDGLFLKQLLDDSGADTSFINICDEPSGNALIQVDKHGQNCIIVHGGANSTQLCGEIDNAVSFFENGDYLILQNEINNLDYIIRKGYERKMQIVLNPSPIKDNLKTEALSMVSWFILNEIEGNALTGETEPEAILNKLGEYFKSASVVLTLGSDGAVCRHGGKQYKCKAFKTEAVDTTAAGDTFTGYFFGLLSLGTSIEEALQTASLAAAVAVSRFGAAPSIPCKSELSNFKKGLNC